MKAIAVVSAKGGVGRTTLCANLGAALARCGRPVLAVDMDPQNALRLHLGVPTDHIDGLARATLAGRDWRSACVKAADVMLLPHGALDENDRQAFEDQLLAQPDLLKRRLDSLDLADEALVIIDACAGPSLYQCQVLAAADLVLVATLADAASYASLPAMAQLVQAYCEPREDFIGSGYVINQIDNTRQLGKDMMRVLPAALAAQQFGQHLGGIHRDESVAEAIAFQQLLLDYAPTSMAAVDMLACADALIDMLASALANPA